MMSKQSWVKWGLLFAGSSIAVMQLGSCISQLLLQTAILRLTN